MSAVPTTSGFTTIALVDPACIDGESSLSCIRDRDQHVLVITLLNGPSTAISPTSALDVGAAWQYLDRVAERIGRDGRTVGTIVASGPDPAYELALVAIEHDADRVVFPTSVLRLDRRAPHRLARLAPVAIEAPLLLVG